MSKKTLLLLLIIILGSLLSFKIIAKQSSNLRSISGLTVVTADDDEDDDEDEDEDEDEDDEDDDEDERYEDSYETVEEYIVVEEPAPIISYITVFDAGYDKDTDGDSLVDALDPNPTVKESQFFTDDDKDGISNAYDTFPNEDDFLYLEFIDENANGLIDDLEPLN